MHLNIAGRTLGDSSYKKGGFGQVAPVSMPEQTPKKEESLDWSAATETTVSETECEKTPISLATIVADEELEDSGPSLGEVGETSDDSSLAACFFNGLSMSLIQLAKETVAQWP